MMKNNREIDFVTNPRKLSSKNYFDGNKFAICTRFMIRFISIIFSQENIFFAMSL